MRLPLPLSLRRPDQTHSYDDPILRDVVNTGDTGDEVTIRFTTNNPGPWFLHCHIGSFMHLPPEGDSFLLNSHIDFHLNFGLAGMS